jgi:NapC/NirT cytochrome c family, N-terminal region
MRKRTFPKDVYNVVSLAGVGIALFGLASIAILWILNIVSGQTNPYLGIFTFMLFPGIMVFGLLLIPIGMWRKRRRVARGQEQLLVVDLTQPQHRNALIVFVAGTSVFLLLTTIGLYEGYHYTESVEFCGKVCHQVMAPEHTAYLNSPHARVDCVQCHIGPGADWFVKSKLSGTRQVFKAALHTYPRPIPTPIVNLRPAQETCEQCHWPEKFFPATELNRDYFLGDRNNTHWRIKLLMKIGGTDISSPDGHPTGIHWHVSKQNRMEYVAADSSRQEFDLVRWTRGDRTIVYTKGGRPYPDSVLAQATAKGFLRTLDCIDCHNRPSHRYESPMRAVNAALVSGRLDPSIPWIKREAVRVMSREYTTNEGARDSIALGLRAFYDHEGTPLPPAAVAAVQEAFRENMFPEMRARWDRYPDNRSHFFFRGCFRCHGSELATSTGQKISGDCNLCHTIVAQGPVTKDTAAGDTLSSRGLAFRHPIDIEGGERVMRCFECHIGDGSIYLPAPADSDRAERLSP